MNNNFSRQAKHITPITKNRLNISVIFALLLVGLAFSPLVLNAQNSLDTTFNAGVTDSSGNTYISAVQPDGKILVGGRYRFVNGTQRGYLVRLNANGTIDNSFNAGGSGANRHVLEIVILANGKILIGGDFSTYNGTSRGGIARLNADGTLDATFNPGTGISGGRLTSIVLQPDGKIIAAGQGVTGYNGNTSNGIFRINPDGSFDASFVSGFTSSPSIEQIALQTDGKIVIGGIFTGYGGSTITGLVRVNADGSRDTTFNSGGSDSAARSAGWLFSRTAKS